MNYNLSATLNKILGIAIVFILFYTALQLPSPIGQAIILAIIAINVVELKILLTTREERQHDK